MQFPSLRLTSQQIIHTLQRFPLALLSAGAAAALAVYMTELSAEEPGQLLNAMLTAVLGIPLFITITLFSERNNSSFVLHTLTHLGGIAVLAGYYFTLPNNLEVAPFKHVYRYILYIFALHLLVAVGPFGGTGNTKAFWQYNKTLFLRFLTAVLFSGILFAGLAIALGSIQVLLEVQIDSVRYLQLFIIIGGLFNTWFFLAGIPSSIDSSSANSDYPKGLRIFTQNILIPLVGIYLAILYLYTGKIILQWSWPEGWVANLVLSFSITGILALLLLHPIRNDADKRWINTFSSSFFIALVPLVILLLLAIYRRIWDYGFTVERYFVLAMGIWLAGIVLYYIVKGLKNIKVIPGSLCIIAILISFGPWGAFSVSEQSQINRLENYMLQNDLLQNGTVQQAEGEVPFQDRLEISNIIRYLNEKHGLGGIQPWFQQDLNSLTTKAGEDSSAQLVGFYDRPQRVTELMGINYVQPGIEAPERPSYTQLIAKQDDMLDVNDVSIILQNLSWSAQQSTQERSIGNGRTLIIESDTSGMRLYLQNNQQNAIVVDMKQLVRNLANKFPSTQRRVPNNAMEFDYSSGPLSIRIYFDQISWRTETNQIIPENVRFDLGIR